PVFRRWAWLASLYRRSALSERWWVRLAAIACILPFSVVRRTGNGSQMNSHEQSDAGKLQRPLFEAIMRLTVVGPMMEQVAAENKLRELAGAFAVYGQTGSATFRAGPIRRGPPAKRHRPFLLASDEIASLWH